MSRETTTSSIPPRTSPTQKAVLAAAIVVSFLSLAWVLQDFEPEKLAVEVSNMNWGWVALAALVDILVYFLQGWRWSLLLRPVAEIPYARSVRAVYVGLFANELLPLRTGELIRCYLQGRWSGLPFSVVLSSAIIERIFDGVWLILCLIAATRVTAVPEFSIKLGEILAVFVVLAAVLLGAAIFFRHQTRAAFETNRFTRKLNILLEDLYLIGHSRYLYFSAIASLPYLLLQVLPIYALTHGYRIPISLPQAFTLMVILRLVAVVPQAPGNLGAFQAAAALGLTMFGVDASMAKRFSFVMWGVITLPLLIVGFIAFAITGIRLSELRQQAKLYSR